MRELDVVWFVRPACGHRNNVVKVKRSHHGFRADSTDALIAQDDFSFTHVGNK